MFVLRTLYKYERLKKYVFLTVCSKRQHRIAACSHVDVTGANQLPCLHADGLPWAFPGWVANDPLTGTHNDTGTPYDHPEQTCRYILEWCGNVFFAPFYAKNEPFYQDRLGTNGKS